jgi:hypothetical protein
VQLGNREAGEREVEGRRQLAREAFDFDDDAGGKAGWAPASRLFVEAGEAFQEEALPPLTDNLPRQVAARRDVVIAEVLGGENDDFGPDDVSIR